MAKLETYRSPSGPNARADGSRNPPEREVTNSSRNSPVEPSNRNTASVSQSAT